MAAAVGRLGLGPWLRSDALLLTCIGVVFAEATLVGSARTWLDESGRYRLGWIVLFVVGTVTPVVLARLFGAQTPILGRMRSAFAAATALWAVAMLLATRHVDVLLLATLQFAGAHAAGAYRELRHDRVATIAATTLVVWFATIGLADLVPIARLLAAPDVYAVTVVAALILAAAATWSLPPSAARHLTARRAIFALALPVYVACSFTTDHLYLDAIANHQSFWLGPAELVRRGGWLLWDIASEYGFLSILTIAAVPATSPWQALFVEMGALTALEAALLSWVLSRRPGGVRAALLAVAIVVGTTIMQLGADSGPRLLPISGPARWFWTYAILAAIVAISRSSDARRRRLAALGTAVWIAGTLWSAESAIYTGCAWLTFVAWSTWGERARAADAVRAVLRELAVLAAVVVAVVLWYLVRLGHPPDIVGFVEFGVTFAGGHAAYPLNPWGAVWYLLLVVATLAAATVAYARAGRRTAAAAVAAAAACVWASSSYFVVRSVDYNVNSIYTTTVFALALLLTVLDRERLDAAFDRAARVVVVAALAFGAALSFAHADGTSPNGYGIQSLYLPFTPAWSFDVHSRAGAIDPALDAALSAAGYRAGEPAVVAFDADFTATSLVARRADGTFWEPLPWNPAYPMEELLSVGPERAARYLARYREAVPPRGWVVAHTARDWCAWFGARNARALRSGGYVISRCEPR